MPQAQLSLIARQMSRVKQIDTDTGGKGSTENQRRHHRVGIIINALIPVNPCFIASFLSVCFQVRVFTFRLTKEKKKRERRVREDERGCTQRQQSITNKDIIPVRTSRENEHHWDQRNGVILRTIWDGWLVESPLSNIFTSNLLSRHLRQSYSPNYIEITSNHIIRVHTTLIYLPPSSSVFPP